MKELGPLGRVDVAINASVHRCSCWRGRRITGHEYDYGGCFSTRDIAIAQARRLSANGKL